MARSLISQSRNVSPSQKARKHQVTGVGRSKTKRQFFGLTTADERKLTDKVEAWLNRTIR